MTLIRNNRARKPNNFIRRRQRPLLSSLTCRPTKSVRTFMRPGDGQVNHQPNINNSRRSNRLSGTKSSHNGNNANCPRLKYARVTRGRRVIGARVNTRHHRANGRKRNKLTNFPRNTKMTLRRKRKSGAGRRGTRMFLTMTRKIHHVLRTTLPLRMRIGRQLVNNRRCHGPRCRRRRTRRRLRTRNMTRPLIITLPMMLNARSANAKRNSRGARVGRGRRLINGNCAIRLRNTRLTCRRVVRRIRRLNSTILSSGKRNRPRRPLMRNFITRVTLRRKGLAPWTLIFFPVFYREKGIDNRARPTGDAVEGCHAPSTT